MKLEKTLIYLRWCTFLALGLMTWTDVQAQRFSAGLVAGLNASQIDGDELAGFDKVGLTGGIKTTMEFESVWRMNMEFLYSERGSRPDIFNPEYDPDIEISLKYIEIPVYISLGGWWQEEGEYYKVSAQASLSYGRLLLKPQTIITPPKKPMISLSPTLVKMICHGCWGLLSD